MKHFKSCLFGFAFLLITTTTLAQVGIGTTTPNANAVLELKSPGNNQGFLVPRLTTAERTATSFTSSLGATEVGLLIFDTDTGKFYYWSGAAWIVIEDSTGTDSQTLSYSAATGQLSITGGNNVNLTGTLPGGTAGGDLAGTYPNPAIANNAVVTNKINNAAVTTAKLADNSVTSVKIVDGTIATGDIADAAITDQKISNVAPAKITQSGATTGQVLKWNGSAWVPQADNAGSGTVTNIATGTGLSGGPITNTGTISLANTAVSAGTYGSGTQVPQFTVDAQGRLTSASNTTITGVTPGGSASGDLTGTYPGPTIATSAGSNVVTAINNASTTGTINTNRLNTSVVLDSESPSAGDVSGNFAGGLTVNNNAITTGKILDGTIANADISTTAGIAVSKLGAGTNGQFLSTTAGNPTWSNLPDASATNEIQDLSSSASGTNRTINISGGGTSTTIDVADNDNSTSNEIQNLSLTVGGASPTLRRIDISGGNNITLDVADNDNSVTNEIQNLSSSASGTDRTINISGGTGTTINVADNDNSTTNEIQNLSLTVGGASPTLRRIDISGGNNVTLDVADGDNSSTNEIQTLSVSGNQLTISSGNTVTIPTSNLNGGGNAQQVTYWDGATSLTGDDNFIWDNKLPGLGIGVTPRATMHLGGSLAVGITISSGGVYSVKERDYVIIAPNATTDIALPDAETLIGRILIIRSTDAKGVRVFSASGKDKIDRQDAINIADADNGSVYSITLIAAQAGDWLSISKAVK